MYQISVPRNLNFNCNIMLIGLLLDLEFEELIYLDTGKFYL
jgi:hypothetical protein